MSEKITSRLDDLREYAIGRLKDFLDHNQRVIVIEEDDNISYDIIFNKNKIYADEIKDDCEIEIFDLSLDELYKIYEYLEEFEYLKEV